MHAVMDESQIFQKSVTMLLQHWNGTGRSVSFQQTMTTKVQHPAKSFDEAITRIEQAREMFLQKVSIVEPHSCRKCCVSHQHAEHWVQIGRHRTLAFAVC